jgi:ABC-type lipopolysaccharide export system ATPase subunit
MHTRKHRHRASKTNRKGGNLNTIINQAITPGLLLLAQQTYNKKGSKSRKNSTNLMGGFNLNNLTNMARSMSFSGGRKRRRRSRKH